MHVNNSFCQETTEKPEKPKAPLNDRIFISPDIGLQFGTVTVINISPKAGYRITEKLAAGLGLTYIYLNDKRYKSIGYTNESNIYGGSIFAQYQLIEQLRAYTEYEALSLETYDSNIFNATGKIVTRREFVPSLLAGGGYSQSMGGNSSLVLMILYNLLDGPKSIYSNPVIRVGFNIGL